MSLLTIGIIMLVLGIMFFVLFYYEILNEDFTIFLKIISGVAFVVFGFVGLGIHGAENYETMIVKEIKITSIIKTKSRVMCEFEDENKIYHYESDKIGEYTSINDSTIFYLVRYFNYYGFEKFKRYDNLTEEKYYLVKDNLFSKFEENKVVESFEID